jgi:uncharacterized protein YecT (DUF1311 family)
MTPVKEVPKTMRQKLAMIVTFILLFTPSWGWSQEATLPEPSDLTSQGNIALQARETYKNALNFCYHGTPGNMPHDAQFLACLKQQVRTHGSSLESAFKGAARAVSRYPGQRVVLSNSQSAWSKWRDTNCSFVKTMAPGPDYTEEFFYDCILRTTIDRETEIKSLIGD